jgi:hypothetical protein
VRVPGTGGRRAAPGRPGNWPIWCGEADKAPFISYMKGALSHSARRPGSRQADTPATTPTCRDVAGDIRAIPASPMVQAGITTIFPPTATAPTVTASHSRNHNRRGR